MAVQEPAAAVVYRRVAELEQGARGRSCDAADHRMFVRVGADFDDIVARVMRNAPSQHRALVAIDGVDGSGKTTFATMLAEWIQDRPTIVLHADDYLNPSAIRHAKGRQSPEGFWLDTYNWSAFISYALEPLSAQSHAVYRTNSYDPAADAVIESEALQAPDDALVLVEGMFLHRGELAHFWHYSIFLDVPFQETARRMAERDGSNPDPDHESMRRYVGGQRIYFSSTRPWERASLVVDNTCFSEPRIIDAEKSSACDSLTQPAP